MLIWYSNIPEEVTYFITRIEDYNITFFGMIVMNFLIPIIDLDESVITNVQIILSLWLG